jgi:hypothetical protein
MKACPVEQPIVVEVIRAPDDGFGLGFLGC